MSSVAGISGAYVYTTPTPAFKVPEVKENTGSWNSINSMVNSAGSDNNLLGMMSNFMTVGQALNVFA